MPNEINLSVDCGAACDGVTDDTAAWVTALALSNSTKKSIRWLGTSRITAQLNWPALGSNMGIKGYGMGQSILLCDFGSDPSTVSGINFNMAGATSNIHLLDFTIKGKNDSNTNSPYDLILVNDYVYDMRVDGVEFVNGRHSGFRISSGANPGARVTVENCYFHEIIDANMALTAGAAILTTGYTQLKIARNKFRNVGNGAFSHAIYGQDATDISVTGNDFDGVNSRLHLTGSGNTDVLVSGNHFRAQVSNYVSGNGVLVIGNTFTGCCLRLLDINGILVEGNTFETASVLDLITTLGTPAGVNIVDNTFRYTGATRTSFCAAFVSDLTVTDLVLKGNLCQNVRLARVAAAVRPVVVENVIRVDGANEAVGFITFTSTAGSIDTVRILNNFIHLITPVGGSNRFVEIAGMSLANIEVEQNILIGTGVLIGCVNSRWDMTNSKLVFSYSLAGVQKYLKLPLDGASTSWTHDGSAP